MAVFKCKMCGGDLEIVNGESVCECEYCGTKQTIPTTDSEKLTNLYNRANRLRFNNEFDKAAGIFENITAEYPEEAEAYWGLCLCKYGIEYVDDPATAKKIPTCHRTSLESIFDDSNFDLAQEYADSVAQRLYREEAKEIDRLQKAILDIAKNEKPYDIFICYKETAPDGQRTKDSVMAQDIYDALIAKGYKVFFARITLEDKLGQEYEPYIFSALNSAKVMLAIGTDYEHFNAVWVKNEWSRFLEMMKKDKSKVLIPCYADIDAYDMPQEFKNLQGQDMGKVGFIQDLVRGVGKIIGKEEPKAAVKETVVVQQGISSVNIANLLKRGFLCLSEKKWAEADKFFERVLDEDVDCAEANIGKLMVSLQISNKFSKKELESAFIKNYFWYKEHEDEISRYIASDVNKELTNLIISFPEIEQRLKASDSLVPGLIKKKVKMPIKINGEITLLICDKEYYDESVVVGSDENGGLSIEGFGFDFESDDDKATVIELPEGISRIAYNFLDIDGDCKLILPASLTLLEKQSENCEYEFKGSSLYYIDDGIYYSKDKSILVFCHTDKESFEVPEGVKKISAGAFSYCESLTSITIPESVTSIGDFAFEGCESLASITIPESVTSIDFAFCDCKSLTSITIPESVTSIGDHAFSGCKSLTSIAIPESVTSIGDHAFSGCESLTSIAIPESVTSIGKSAFCKSLSEIITSNSIVNKYLSESSYRHNNIMIYTESQLADKKRMEEEHRRQEEEHRRQEEERRRQEERLRRQQEEHRRQEEAKKALYRSQGVCQYCGGTFKGLFSKSCSSCGKKKDY